MTVFSVSLTECLPPSISTYPSSSTCLLKPYFILTEKNCGTSTGCGWVGAYTAGRKWIGASRRGIGGRCKSPRILCMHFLLPRSASYVISRMVRPLWRIRSVNEYASCEGIKHSESAGWYRGKCYSRLQATSDFLPCAWKDNRKSQFWPNQKKILNCIGPIKCNTYTRLQF